MRGGGVGGSGKTREISPTGAGTPADAASSAVSSLDSLLIADAAGCAKGERLSLGRGVSRGGATSVRPSEETRYDSSCAAAAGASDAELLFTIRLRRSGGGGGKRAASSRRDCNLAAIAGASHRWGPAATTDVDVACRLSWPSVVAIRGGCPSWPSVCDQCAVCGRSACAWPVVHRGRPAAAATTAVVATGSGGMEASSAVSSLDSLLIAVVVPGDGGPRMGIGSGLG